MENISERVREYTIAMLTKKERLLEIKLIKAGYNIKRIILFPWFLRKVCKIYIIPNYSDFETEKDNFGNIKFIFNQSGDVIKIIPFRRLPIWLRMTGYVLQLNKKNG